MRTVLFLIALVVRLAKVQAQESQIYWGESIEGFSVGLSVASSKYNLEKPILVDVYLRNDTKADRPTIAIPARYLISVVATDNARRPVPPKPEFGYDGSLSLRDLHPGQVKKETVDLRDYLYLTNSGTFAVTVKRLLAWPTFALSGSAMLELASTNAAGAANPVRNSAATAQTVRPVQNSTADNTSATKHTPARDNSSTTEGSSANSKPKDAAASPSAAVASSLAETKSFTPTQKVGTGIIAALVALLLAILWRAARRKPEG